MTDKRSLSASEETLTKRAAFSDGLQADKILVLVDGQAESTPDAVMGNEALEVSGTELNPLSQPGCRDDICIGRPVIAEPHFRRDA